MALLQKHNRIAGRKRTFGKKFEENDIPICPFSMFDHILLHHKIWLSCIANEWSKWISRNHKHNRVQNHVSTEWALTLRCDEFWLKAMNAIKSHILSTSNRCHNQLILQDVHWHKRPFVAIIVVVVGSFVRSFAWWHSNRIKNRFLHEYFRTLWSYW